MTVQPRHPAQPPFCLLPALGSAVKFHGDAAFSGAITGDGMNVKDGTYRGSTGFKGWAESPDWIVFERDNGDLVAFNGRDAETGAVTGEGVDIPRHRAK